MLVRLLRTLYRCFLVADAWVCSSFCMGCAMVVSACAAAGVPVGQEEAQGVRVHGAPQQDQEGAAQGGAPACQRTPIGSMIVPYTTAWLESTGVSVLVATLCPQGWFDCIC
jgi:hypothetical protein